MIVNVQPDASRGHTDGAGEERDAGRGVSLALVRVCWCFILSQRDEHLHRLHQTKMNEAFFEI